jgi:hypothetical protein
LGVIAAFFSLGKDAEVIHRVVPSEGVGAADSAALAFEFEVAGDLTQDVRAAAVDLVRDGSSESWRLGVESGHGKPPAAVEAWR